jgi:hypothetical protein
MAGAQRRAAREPLQRVHARRSRRDAASPGLARAIDDPPLVYNDQQMSVASPAYVEIIEFIAAGTTPEAVARFQPSPEAQRRVGDLIEREKRGFLSAEEKAELDHFIELEHILRMAKARAREILSGGP